MKNNIVIILILLQTIMLTISCSSPNEDTGNMKNVKTEVKVSFEFTQVGDVDSPHTQIFLVNNGQKSDLGKFAGNTTLIEKLSYKDFGIPENALVACQTWWAGAGDYFYVAASKTDIEVFQGWADEQQDDAGYHWKKISLK